MSYATEFVRRALLTEVERLKPMLPDTEACRRNVALIEKQAPPEKMDQSKLCDYVNLLARSIPSEPTS